MISSNYRFILDGKPAHAISPCKKNRLRYDKRRDGYPDRIIFIVFL